MKAKLPLASPRQTFNRMLAIVRAIPRGKVMTYGDVAYIAGFPGQARQVGWALNREPGIPWQRVVGAGGKILRPGELGREQRVLLELEGVDFIGIRVDLDRFRHRPLAKQKRKG